MWPTILCVTMDPILSVDSVAMTCEIAVNVPNGMRPFFRIHAAVAFDRLLLNLWGYLVSRTL